MTAKKNNTATAMAPSIVMAFILRFGVAVQDLKLMGLLLLVLVRFKEV